MLIVGKSFFSRILSKLNIKTIAPLCVIHIPLGPQYRVRAIDSENTVIVIQWGSMLPKNSKWEKLNLNNLCRINGMEALMNLYIYKHKLGPPESLTSTSISSSGACGVNLVMTQLPGWKPAAKSSTFTNLFENPI